MNIPKVDHGRIAGQLGRPGGKIVMGVDGYIDEVWQIVESRVSREEYKLFEKLSDYNQAMASCGGGGFSNEILRKRQSYGGFTANTGKAILKLGVKPAMLGMFGVDRIEPVFAEFAETTKLTSVGDPGISVVYEFTDGKLMLTYIQEVMGFCWSSMTEIIDEDVLKALFTDADIIALGYWALTPDFDNIVEQICRLMHGNEKKQRMFFDFSDLRRRDEASLKNSIEKLGAFGRQIPMTLSLNEHEAEMLFAYYGESFLLEADGAGEQTERVRGATGFDELIVHTPYFAVSASVSEGVYVVPQHYCEAPVITAGAGDNFNGGYIISALKGLDMTERLRVANATTYQYLKNGHSPDMEELFAELVEAEKPLLEEGCP
jgi:sugar/nucleoside kinase (ribokinase family)